MEGKSRLATEIGFADFGVCAESGGLVLEGDAAGFEDVTVMGDFEGEVGVLFDEENGDALGFVDLDDFLENGFDEERGDAEGGFVEHEEAGLAHEGAADGEHLLFAAGKGAGDLFVAFLEAREGGVDEFEIAFYAGLIVAEECAEFEIFADGEIGEDHAAFGDL